MRISEFETCPEHSNKFVTGAAFSVGGHVVEISVVNEYNVDIGCGSNGLNCLGAGSLEIVIDGVKTNHGGDFKLNHGKDIRVLAFNTFYQCSRKWYDFDVASDAKSAPKKQGRGLRTPDAAPGVFDIITGLKNSMIDKVECDKWIEDRMRFGDLFEQPGHYSTIIVQTEDISFHVEYKQESERCNAHNLDVWVSSVSPQLMRQTWKGVIGETRNAPTVQKDLYDRDEVLKFPDDEAYEVVSPSSNKCKSCAH